ncbi:hypothetical protein LOTGIDRAFT_236580 [Lottia gigantea]|uniref:Uncharacterized protein n=1 Tax=Lottia gigantea TaxID=225164 RepID=V3YZF9_LOTGI|nr:hypothetical protein LOTGIDRAFT_236580 [Lottia gigantea]ESO83573.1 hypothetical protein LOTGIDRAFT_236580 [Lottia gigantea]
MLTRFTTFPRMAYQHFNSLTYLQSAAKCSKMAMNTKITKPCITFAFAEKRFLQFSSSMHLNCTRNFHRPEDEYDNQPAPAKTIQKIKPHSAMGVRLANENGYLSWCRNAYLSCSVAVMMTHLGNGNLLLHYAASGALVVSLLNLVTGTTGYIVQLLALKHSVGMSMFSTLLNISFAVIHLCAWLIVIFLFLAYPENELVVIELEKKDNVSDD